MVHPLSPTNTYSMVNLSDLRVQLGDFIMSVLSFVLSLRSLSYFTIDIANRDPYIDDLLHVYRSIELEEYYPLLVVL